VTTTNATPRFRIGLVSDTHGLLREEAIAALRGSDHLIHAGDIGDPGILQRLSTIAPLTRSSAAVADPISASSKAALTSTRSRRFRRTSTAA